MSLKELLDEFNKTIKPQLGEILTLLKNQQLNNNIEAAAAKIINELKASIHECPCNQEILDALLKEKAKGIIIVDDNTPTPKRGPWKYSYPNYNVGNEDLGSGKNPNSLSWPPSKS